MTERRKTPGNPYWVIRHLTDKDGGLSVCMLSIESICNMLNIPDCIAQIENRIMLEVDDYPEAGNSVYFEAGKMQLDNTGIFLLSHIFTSYADQDAVIAIWKQLRDLNKIRRDQYQIYQAIQIMRPAQVMALFMAAMRASDRKAAAIILKMIIPAYLGKRYNSDKAKARRERMARDIADKM